MREREVSLFRHRDVRRMSDRATWSVDDGPAAAGVPRPDRILIAVRFFPVIAVSARACQSHSAHSRTAAAAVTAAVAE